MMDLLLVISNAAFLYPADAVRGKYPNAVPRKKAPGLIAFVPEDAHL